MTALFSLLRSWRRQRRDPDRGVAVMVMLLAGGSRDWFARKNAPPQMPMGTTQPWG